MKKILFVLLALGILGLTPPVRAKGIANEDAKPVARIGQTVLTESQMKEELGASLYEVENNLYQLKKNWIEQHAKTLLFQQAATAAGMGVDQWRVKEIDNHVAAPTKAEIDQIVERFPPAMRSSSDTLRQATEYLTSQKRAQKENEVYQQLTAKYPVEVLVTKPVAPHIDVTYSADDPVLGNKNARVTIVEFTDFQCPFCRRAQETLKQVEKVYAGKVKLVARQYPLPMHPRAKLASEAALCAKAQGKFWEMRDKLFEKQQLEDADFKRYAQELKLNTKKFDQCMSSHEYAPRVDADIADGQRYGVRGTPHFFVNGQPINGAQPFEVFDSAIKDALAKK